MQCQTTGVRLSGLASAVPAACVVGADPTLFGAEDAAKISSSLGVQHRHVVSPGMCTSDLCYAAAVRLLEELDWDLDSIDGLIFISQTPDYVLPATSCTLHARLGLSKHCAAFDVNLGCSGYVYGLWMASQFLSSGSLKRVLLLVGDTVSQIVATGDRAAAPLFGDAGTATVLEHDPTAPPLQFTLGTDGSGWKHLQVPAGGFRQRTASETSTESPETKTDAHLLMNGAEIFAFTLREVPSLVKNTLADAQWSLDDVDAVIMHQANQMMLSHLAKKLKIPQEKFVLNMGEFGNTSSASIPLAMTDKLSERMRNESLRCLFVGFGVGLSWAAVAMTCGPLVAPPLVLVESQTPAECAQGAA